MVKGYRVGDTSLVVWWNDTDGEIAHAWDSVRDEER